MYPYSGIGGGTLIRTILHWLLVQCPVSVVVIEVPTKMLMVNILHYSGGQYVPITLVINVPNYIRDHYAHLTLVKKCRYRKESLGDSRKSP